MGRAHTELYAKISHALLSSHNDMLSSGKLRYLLASSRAYPYVAVHTPRCVKRYRRRLVRCCTVPPCSDACERMWTARHIVLLYQYAEIWRGELRRGSTRIQQFNWQCSEELDMADAILAQAAGMDVNWDELQKALPCSTRTAAAG
jgi:hypothetical protein